MRKLQDFDYSGKRIFLRVDLNVPVSNGIILDYTRIDKIIPTIKYLLKQNAKIIIASHFGRPKGEFDSKYSLEFLVDILSEKIGQEVSFCSDISKTPDKRIILLENLRFHPGETKNDPEFAKQLAALADFYVNDAFSCSHRAHASIVGIAAFLPSAAGLLLTQEIENLNLYLSHPAKPMMAIIGGSKVSTKLDLLMELVNKVDYLAIGGAMANTFLKAKGYEIGNSFYEPDLITKAQEIMAQNCEIILPIDVVIAKEISENAETKIIPIEEMIKNQMILDLGPKSVAQIKSILQICKTVILNGPVGVFECTPFSKGTIAIAQEVASLSQKGLISIAGGGDIVAAISQAGLFEEFTYISTAGGAFLEWLEGKKLPGLTILE